MEGTSTGGAGFLISLEIFEFFSFTEANEKVGRASKMEFKKKKNERIKKK